MRSTGFSTILVWLHRTLTQRQEAAPRGPTLPDPVGAEPVAAPCIAEVIVLDTVPRRRKAEAFRTATRQFEQALQATLDDVSTTLSTLEAEIHGLVANTSVAIRLAHSTSSTVNKMVADADQSSDAVEGLAKIIAALDRQSAGPPCDAIESLRNSAVVATRLSFDVTLQTLQSRSTAKQLAKSLGDIHRKVRELQGLGEDARRRIEGLAGDVAGGLGGLLSADDLDSASPTDSCRCGQEACLC